MKKMYVALMLISLLTACTCFSTAMAAEPVPTYFSFASDTYHSGPTFTGAYTTFTSQAEVDLMVDLNNNNYGGLVTFLSQLQLKAQIYNHQAFLIGSQWLHVWKVYAEMTFIHVNPTLNSPILGIVFKEGVLTSWSPSATTIGETMTLQDSVSADQSIYMTAYPLLNGIGVKPEHLALSQDVAFTFTNVHPTNDSNLLVGIDKSGGLQAWASEGSFSASAYLKY